MGGRARDGQAASTNTLSPAEASFGVCAVPDESTVLDPAALLEDPAVSYCEHVIFISGLF